MATITALSSARNARPVVRFTVSRDEEHVSIVIDSAAGRFDLGERVHHYALLLLVRRHLQHVDHGADAGSAGWIACSDLAHMLGLDLSHLNVQIHRLRRQILDAGLPPRQAAALIQRRRGQLRVAGCAVSISQGVAVQFDSLL